MTEELFQGLLADFVFDAQERIELLEQNLIQLKEASASQRDSLLIEIKRELHTLKGNAGMMGLKDLQSLAHSMEDLLDFEGTLPEIQELLSGLDAFRDLTKDIIQLEDPSQEHSSSLESEVAQGSIRVPFSSLNTLVDLLAEMVVFQNQLRDSIQQGPTLQPQSEAWENVSNSEEALGKTLGLIQDWILQLRLVPLGNLFSSLARIAHDEGNTQGKKVRLITEGGDTPVDKAVLEVASEALGHLVRNAVIHGIETPEERRASDKPSEGLIQVRASRHSNEVWIDVEDNGRGIDIEHIRASAEAQGVNVSGTEEDLSSLIFMDGFSTQEETNMSAGRGVGLSAVVDALRRMSGRIDVQSNPGEGTRFRLHLPLSVSIIRALMVEVDGEEYAVPISSIIESRPYQAEEGHEMNRAEVFSWRGQVIPLLDLGYAFGTSAKPRRQGAMIIIDAGGKNRGLLADCIHGIRDVIVKGLDEIFGPPKGIFGSTILGDGRVILILDPPGLAEIKPFVGASA